MAIQFDIDKFKDILMVKRKDYTKDRLTNIKGIGKQLDNFNKEHKLPGYFKATNKEKKIEFIINYLNQIIDDEDIEKRKKLQMIEVENTNGSINISNKNNELLKIMNKKDNEIKTLNNRILYLCMSFILLIIISNITTYFVVLKNTMVIFRTDSSKVANERLYRNNSYLNYFNTIPFT